MEGTRNPLSFYIDPLKEEMHSITGCDFDDTMYKSCYEANTNHNSGNGASSILTSLEVVSPRAVNNPQSSNFGECTFEAPDEEYFDNFEQLLIDDKQVTEEMGIHLSSEKTEVKDTKDSTASKTFFKPKAKYTTRVDVVNKGLLRMVKSFYLDLLYEQYPEYKSKRLCRVNKSHLLDDIMNLLNCFPQRKQEDSQLGVYIFCALRPSDCCHVTTDKVLHDEVKTYFDCISKYSHKRLQEIFKTTFAKSIFELILTNEGLFDSLLETNKLSKRNKSAYEKGLLRFKHGFNLP
jgi:hypothetical protein